MRETKYSIIINNPAMSPFKRLLCRVDGREPKLIERADSLSLSAGEPCDVRLRFVSGRYSSEEIVMPLTEWNMSYRLVYRYRWHQSIGLVVLLAIQTVIKDNLGIRSPWRWPVFLVSMLTAILPFLILKKNTIILKLE